MDLTLRNPLNVEIDLSDLAVVIECLGEDNASLDSLIHTDVVDSVTLGPEEQRTV